MIRILFQFLEECRYHARGIAGLVLSLLARLVLPVVDIFLFVFWFGIHTVWFVVTSVFADGGRILKILPSVFALCGAGVLVLLANTKSSAELDTHYALVARRAIAGGDLAAADLYFRRVIQGEPNHVDAQFGLAYIADQRGDRDRTRRIMRRIASSHKRGHARAHLWLAKDLMGREGTRTREELEIIEQHLIQTVNQKPTNAEAVSLLVMIYMRSNRASEAIRHLVPAIEANPQLGLTLGAAYLSTGQTEQAKAPIRKAAEYFGKLAEQNPKDVRSRLLWAECKMLQKDFGGAREILEVGFSHDQSEEYRLAITKTLIAESDALRGGGEQDLGRSMQLLNAAMRTSPGNHYVLTRWAAIASQPGPQRERIKAALNALLLEGTDTAGVHLTLGTIAAFENDHEAAKQHYRLALLQEPQMASLLNNYAWTLARADPPDHDRALELANQAVNASPNHPEFRETRGQILAMMQRWEEAISDLEKVLATMSNRPDVRETLAQAYSAIGQEDLAKAHRALIGQGK